MKVNAIPIHIQCILKCPDQSIILLGFTYKGMGLSQLQQDWHWLSELARKKEGCERGRIVFDGWKLPDNKGLTLFSPQESSAQGNEWHIQWWKATQKTKYTNVRCMKSELELLLLLIITQPITQCRWMAFTSDLKKLNQTLRGESD